MRRLLFSRIGTPKDHLPKQLPQQSFGDEIAFLTVQPLFEQLTLKIGITFALVVTMAVESPSVLAAARILS